MGKAYKTKDEQFVQKRQVYLTGNMIDRANQLQQLSGLSFSALVRDMLDERSKRVLFNPIQRKK